MNITDIKYYDKNAKIHPPEQIEALAKIVKEVGWRQPVLVNQKKLIIVGHGRFETYLKYQNLLKPIWVIDDKGVTVHGEPESTPLTEAQEKAYRLADNKLAETDIDKGFVLEELAALDGILAKAGGEAMVDLTGYNLDDFYKKIEDNLDLAAKIEEKKKIECPSCGHQFIPKK